MFSNIPHKKLIVSAALALLIIMIGLIASGKAQIYSEKKLATQDISKNVVLSVSTTTAYVDRDTDADGLPDWEEHLFLSNSLKFDTDGDGTPDGEEVRLGRDPAKANTAKGGQSPNDMLPSIQDPHFATSTTDVLGIKKEYFAKFLTAEGNKVREQTYKELMKRFDPSTVKATNELINLNVSSDNSPENIHAYGNAFGRLIKKYTRPTHRKEEAILKDGISASSSQPLRELQLPAIDYMNFSTDLKILSVPSSLASSHLKIVNGYEQMSKGLLAMQALYSDPIVGAGGYEAYTIGKVDVLQGYAEIVVIFAKNKNAYTSNEAGYPFYSRLSNTPLPTVTSQQK